MGAVFISVLLILSEPLAPPLKGHAYLDPGSGSFILQILIASLVGAAFVVKAYWRKIVGFVRRDQAVEEQPPLPEDDPHNG
jgi:hypothetical protein